ncbi:hypothetical protein ASZ90_019658 [hydrocarbon metagenome]|uniref:4Fe-4S ferredoxin-type domain-containing protein n=1 Tax=hydrocarbon metagenome TaxID=938273 RepID=A0A0W8E2P0_9ZZZZ
MYIIDKNKCSSCGLCADVCPVEAISIYGEYTIDQDKCIACGWCQGDCPAYAIMEC